MDLSRKTILITGASRGIGNALAKVLDKSGTNLILVSRNIKDLAVFSHHKVIRADLTIQEDIEKLIREIGTAHIDALLNVAGIGIYKDLEGASVKDLHDSLTLNTIAPFTLIKNLYKNIEKSDLSLILSIGSGAGVMPFKNRSVYCASKFALRGLMLSLAQEYQNRKPHFCLVTLGSTITTFAGKSIEEQQNAQLHGRAAFPVEWVAEKLVEIIKNPKRETEVVLYPSEHGFGEWKKP